MSKAKRQESVDINAAKEPGSYGLVSFADLTAPKVEQGRASGKGQFVYVDISSVDNKAKRITEPKALDVSAAPSRAKQRLQADDVLVSMTRPNLNAVAMVPPELDGSIGSTGFHVLRAHEGTEPRWLYYAVQTRHFISAMSELVQGALYPAVRPKDIRAFEIPHPPLDQQKRIVAEIEKQFSRLDEAVTNLKRVKANLKRYKTAVLKAAVEGRLVETEAELARLEGRGYETGEQLLQRILETRRSQPKGKGKYKEPAAPDTTDLPELPEGWVWASAEQISDFITKGTTPAATKLSEGVGEVQFLKVYNLTFDGSLNHSYKPAFVSRSTHDGELARSKVQAGDVLINIVGPPLGQVSVVPVSLVEANINQAIARFRPIPPLDSKFLSLTLLTEEVMRWAIRKAKTTAGQSNLTLELCRALPIPIPPIAEQVRIVAEVDRRLSLIRGTESQVTASHLRAERLQQSILARGFWGGFGDMVDSTTQFAQGKQ